MNIKDKLLFSIINRSTSNTVCVAMATGHVDVDGAVINENEVYLHKHNVTALHDCGYTGVDAIVDDQYDVESGLPVEIRSINSEISLRAIKDYLRLNPRMVKSVTLTTNNTALYDGAFLLATLSPFHKENTREVQLTTYFSVNQYQSNKITVDYAPDELQWNDNLFWAISAIPPAANANTPTQVTVMVEFYD